MKDNKYRVIKKTFLDGRIRYRVQERVLYFFWCDTYYHPLLLKYKNLTKLGIDHESEEDAVSEIEWNESCDKSSRLVKSDIIYIKNIK